MSNSQRSEAGPHSTDQLAAGQQAAGKPEESKWAAGQLAYVLDDEPQVRAIVRKILASIGFLSQEFTGPVALFAEMKKTSPELIVLDLALGPVRCGRGHPLSRDLPLQRRGAADQRPRLRNAQRHPTHR